MSEFDYNRPEGRVSSPRESEQSYVNSYGWRDPAILTPVLICLVFFTVTGLLALGLFNLVLPILSGPSIVGSSFAGGAIAAFSASIWLASRNRRHQTEVRADRIANREAETQKQINQMHARNSRVPKVKR